jgi:hypothetical protein
MDHITLTTNLTPTIDIAEVHGYLQIKGWVRSEVFARTTASASLKYEQTDAGVRLSCSSDLILRVPREATIKIGQVYGSLRVKYLDRSLEISSIAGGLGLRQVGNTQINTVEGDVLIKQALNAVKIGKISGSAILRDIQGACHLEHIAGNLDVRDARGDLLADVGGHTNVQVGLLAGKNYRVSCKGNLHCQVPQDASAQVDLSSEAQDINVIQPGQNNTYHQSQYSLKLGAGDAKIDLEAGGKLLFTTGEPEWNELEDFDQVLNEEFTRLSEELTNQIEMQIEAHMKTFNTNMEKLAESLQSSGIPTQLANHLVWKVRATGDRVTTHAQEKMRRAQEKIERKLAAAQRKAEMNVKGSREPGSHRHHHHTWRINWAPDRQSENSTHEKPEQANVSQDERLTVLRLLEQKKITSEEAEKLLTALEGSGG